jgi:hypothetical protein
LAPPVNQRMVANRNCPNYDAGAALGSSGK